MRKRRGWRLRAPARNPFVWRGGGGAIQSDVFGVRNKFEKSCVALKETVRAELVEACSRTVRDAQSASAASVFLRLCPSTG